MITRPWTPPPRCKKCGGYIKRWRSKRRDKVRIAKYCSRECVPNNGAGVRGTYLKGGQ